MFIQKGYVFPARGETPLVNDLRIQNCEVWKDCMRRGAMSSSACFRHGDQEINLPVLDFGTLFKVCFPDGKMPNHQFIKETFRCFFIHIGYALR